MRKHDRYFLRVTKGNCKEITSYIADNGLFEVTAPNNSTDADITKYLRNIKPEQYNEILDKQKKYKEKFRKNASLLINKYKEEFNLPKSFGIRLRLQIKTKKICDCNVERHGIDFEAHLELIAILIYSPADLVEKIIKAMVYSIACEYENLWAQIDGLSAGIMNFPDPEIIAESHSKIPEEDKYKVTLNENEISKIETEYKTASEQFSKINDIGVFG